MLDMLIRSVLILTFHTCKESYMLLDYSANIFNATVIVAANKAHLYVRWVAIINLTSYVIDLFKF